MNLQFKYNSPKSVYLNSASASQEKTINSTSTSMFMVSQMWMQFLR